MLGIAYDLCKMIGVAVLLLGLATKGNVAVQEAAVLMSAYAIWRGAVRASGGVRRLVLWSAEVGFLVIVSLTVCRHEGGVMSVIYVMLSAFSAAVIARRDLFYDEVDLSSVKSGSPSSSTPGSISSSASSSALRPIDALRSLVKCPAKGSRVHPRST